MNSATKTEILALAAHLDTIKGGQILAKNTRLAITDDGTACRRMWKIAGSLNERINFAPVEQTQYSKALAMAWKIAESLDD